MASFKSRRVFLKSGMLASGAALLGPAREIHAVEPIQRPYGSKMKLSLAAYSYRKYLAQQDPPTMTIMGFLDECAKLGLGAAEPTSYYFPPNPTREFLLEFRRKAHLLGLDISGTAVGNTFTYPKGEKRQEQLNYVKQWVDYAAIMGAPCIRIFAGNVPDGLTRDEAVQNAIETTKLACDYAGSKGIFLALENHGGIVATPPGVLKIVENVNSPWFGVNFDSGNFHGEDPYAELEAIAPYTVNAQLKVEMRPAGADKKQPADLSRVIDILDRAGYRGYVALEYEADEEPKEAVPNYLTQLKRILKSDLH